MKRIWLPVCFLGLAGLATICVAIGFAVGRANWASTDNAQVWAPIYQVVPGAAGRIVRWTPPQAGGVIARGAVLGEVEAATGVQVLRAPHQGRLVGDFGYVGALVQSGQEVAMLADLQHPYVLAYIDETSATHLREGETADVRFADDPGRLVSGTLAKIYPAVAQVVWPLPATSTGASYSKQAQWVPVRITFPSGTAVPGYIGMSASVRISIGGGGS